MSRVRISTTVDAEQLEHARELLPVSDSKLLDRALVALLQELEREAELRALSEHPYEADPNLSWSAPAAPPLPYDGEIPKDVIELAAKRRRRRR